MPPGTVVVILLAIHSLSANSVERAEASVEDVHLQVVDDALEVVARVEGDPVADELRGTDGQFAHAGPVGQIKWFGGARWKRTRRCH